MILHPPMVITSRLMAGVKVPGGYVAVEPTGETDRYGKPKWRYSVDVDGWEEEGDDLWGWGDARAIVGTLLAFLGAAGEGWDYEIRTGRESDNASLFPARVAEWAHMNSDELDCIRMDLEGEDASE